MNALKAAVDAAIPLIKRRLEMQAQAPFSEDMLRRGGFVRVGQRGKSRHD